MRKRLGVRLPRFPLLGEARHFRRCCGARSALWPELAVASGVDPDVADAAGAGPATAAQATRIATNEERLAAVLCLLDMEPSLTPLRLPA
jgi:hypothetical protein